MKNTTTKGDATLEGWRREQAATNLSKVKRAKRVEQYVGAEHMGALDRVLLAVRCGAELRIQPAPLYKTIDASLESAGRARFAKASAETLGEVFEQLAAEWAKR